MTYLNTFQSQGIDPLLLDGGDWLFSIKRVHPNPLVRRQMLEKARLLIEAYNRFGYDAAAVAEQDMALGLDILLDLQPSMKFPLLCSNLHDPEGNPVFEGSAVFEREGQQIAVIAVLLPLADTYIAKVAPGYSISDPVVAVREEIEKLPDDIDGVFLLGHINRKDVDRISAEIPEVDFILEPNSYNGNATIWIPEQNNFVETDGALLLKLSGQGSEVGRLDLWLQDRELPWHSIWSEDPAPANQFDPTVTSLAPHIGRHSGMEKMVQRFVTSTRFEKPSDEDLLFKPSDQFLTASTCAGCHLAQTEFWKGTAHARAYETLEKSGDQFRYDCLPCHVLGYGETFIDARNPGEYKDVQCESCHGTNPGHPLDPANRPWPTVDDKSCWSCHNPQETKVPFKPSQAIPKVSCPSMPRNQGG